MGSSPMATSFPFARLAGVGAVVFLANAAMLVLQLVASRLLAPFIGSDLYTWTSIIGVFLTGIALGNAYGGKLADRYPSPKTLAAVLLLGSATAVWMAFAPVLFHGFYRSIPLAPRIPLLSAILCLPAGFVLSLLTPLSIKLGLPDVSKTGRVTGMVFALSTLGCLLGNYVTGFYLVPAFTIDMLVYVAAGSLLVLAVAVFAVLSVSLPEPNPPAPFPKREGGAEPNPPAPFPKREGGVQNSAPGSPPFLGEGPGEGSPRNENPHAFKNIRQAFVVVFLASFCGMTLELTASRLIAEKLGVSLFTWTGIIGVMLAGTALGNLTGGILADRANQPGGMRRTVAWLIAILGGLYIFCLIYNGLKPLLIAIHREQWLGHEEESLLLLLAAIGGLLTALGAYIVAARLDDETLTPRSVLAATLIAGGAGTVCIFITRAMLNHSESLDQYTLISQVIIWTFALFFMPMFALGMVSPQVIRLAVPDVAQVGRVAGRVYAWSTAGAIAGTFATGYLLVSSLGVDRTVLVASAVLVCIGSSILSQLYVRVGATVAGAGLCFSLLPEGWPLATRFAVALAAASLTWLDLGIRFARALSGSGSLAELLVSMKRDDAKEASENVFLYSISIVLGGITGGFILLGRTAQEDHIVVVVETNYYKIKVSKDRDNPEILHLALDHLRHSSVIPDDPTYIYYEHEHIQMEFLRAARAGTPNPKMLVIGGGGYTFPRYAKALLPETELDVVEIDPGVTRVAYEYLGLKKELGIHDFNMDGRQFVAERAAPHSYDLIVQDAVNDLSVPSHLLTKEYNEAVKAAMKPDGVYLLTIIDEIDHGKLWRASMATLRQSFKHVALLASVETPSPALSPDATEEEAEYWKSELRRTTQNRAVYVIFASDRPLDEKALREHTDRAAGYHLNIAALVGPIGLVRPPFHTHVVAEALLATYLEREPGVILTDQYAPVDNLMADVFRRRSK